MTGPFAQGTGVNSRRRTVAMRRALRVVRPSGIASTLALIGVMATTITAVAFFGGAGTGASAAVVTTLNPPTNVIVNASFSTVSVSWSLATAPSGGSMAGYYVERYNGLTRSAACGTNAAVPASYLGPAATSCTDSSVPNGSYTYFVTAVFRSWTAESDPSNSIAVTGDVSPPSQVVSLAASPTNAYFAANRIYYNNTLAGSFRLIDTVTDGGSGPASATFPGLATAGWTHGAETVTTGTGSATTQAYTSSAYSWSASPSAPPTHTVTGKDVTGNAVNTSLSFVADTATPTGGALTVNSVVASGAGTTSSSKSTSITINSRVNWTEAQSATQSGLATSVLTRETAPLVNAVCGTYGSSIVIATTATQTGLTTGCYRFRLTGTDNLGNAASITTVVRLDVTVPTQSFAITSSPVTATYNSAAGRVYYRSNVAGSFTVTNTVTDAASGPASATFPAIATTGWTHNAETASSGTGSPPTVAYASTAYSWTATPSAPASKAFTSLDVAGNSVSKTIAFSADTTGPTGGALNVNGANASAAGSTSNNSTGSWTITRTDYSADAGSGFASSVLTVATAPIAGPAGACGTFGAPTVLTGTPAQSGSVATCSKYVLTGTDVLGNASTLTTTVKSGPYVTSLAFTNLAAGTAGVVGKGDSVVVKWNEQMAVATFCSTWSGNATNQTLSTDNQVVVTLNDGGAANDSMSVTTASGCAFTLGALDLGSTAFNTSGAPVVFKGTSTNKSSIAWTASSFTMTVTLGAIASGSVPAAPVPATIGSFSPSISVTNSAGRATGGTYATASLVLF